MYSAVLHALRARDELEPLRLPIFGGSNADAVLALPHVSNMDALHYKLWCGFEWIRSIDSKRRLHFESPAMLIVMHASIDPV